MKELMVLPVCYLVEESLWKLLEALGADEALLVVQLPITVDYLLCCSEAAPASLTGRIGQGISNAGVGEGEGEGDPGEGLDQCLSFLT